MRKSLSTICLVFVLLLTGSALATNKVVVVPLGGTVGDAVASDVVKGKTFSSKAAGKGISGTLEIREGSTIYTNSIGMKFSLLPAGSFVMGSPDGKGNTTYRPVWPEETGRNDDELQHIVTLTKSFYMQTTEVTQGQWEQVMASGTNPSHFSACGMDCPVEMVSWDEAQVFINALNDAEGRSSCHTTPNTCYSLPTESQWEYAARGGTLSAFYSGGITNTDCSPLDANLDKIGWYCGNSEVSYNGCQDASSWGGSVCAGTHPVAQKEANTWGLYDMSGNVWEWCEDLRGTYPNGPVEDPSGPLTGSLQRVVRGGSWCYDAYYTRSADRFYFSGDLRDYYLGFRLVLASGQ